MRSSILLCMVMPATAFVVPRPAALRQPLFMASSSVANRKDVMPPPPEDQLTMSGDIFALFLYSFLDHSMNDLYVDAMQSSGVDSSDGHLPVWFDHVHTLLQQDQLLTLLSIPNMNYAPIIQTAGTASVVMTTCWLLGGWLSGAFLYQNTIECHTTRMLWVTLKAWLLTTLFMCGLAYGSDMWQGCDCLYTPSVGGLTKADGDYIFDSLTILITWRFMVSVMFGGFTKK